MSSALLEKKRIFSGILLALFLIFFIFKSSVFLFSLLVLLVIFLSLKEFFALTLPKKEKPAHGFCVFLGTMYAISFVYLHHQIQFLILSTVLFIVFNFSYFLFAKPDFSTVLTELAFSLFGSLYIVFLFSHVQWLRQLPSGQLWVFILAVGTFTADTGAYFAGHLFGSKKLAPRVSPGKTFEGLLGGIALSIFSVLLVKKIFSFYVPTYHLILLAFLIATLGPIGDLSESLIKRSLGVKDSGRLIPGHGGILDRIDALLFTSPLVYYYAQALNH